MEVGGREDEPKEREDEPKAKEEEPHEATVGSPVWRTRDLAKASVSAVTLTRSYVVSTLQETYTMYELDVIVRGELQETCHRVKKRYSELHALHCHLEKTYAKTKLPFFPNRIQMLNLDLDGQKRKKALRDYLDFLGGQPLIHNDAKLLQVLHETYQEPPIVLRITILEAISLATTKSGVPDSICRLTMYDDTFSKIGKVAGTLTPSNGRNFNPQWEDQECYFELTDACAGVTLSVWHQNLIFANIFLGRICIDRHTLPRNKSVEHWFPLHPMEGIKGVTVTGAIKLRVDFRTDRREGLEMEPVRESDLSRRLKEQQFQERTTHRLKREKLYRMGQMHLRFIYHPPKGHWEGYLQVEVIECRDLKSKSKYYTTLNLQRGSEDNITPMQTNAKTDSPKNRDVPQIEIGTTEGRTGVSLSSATPKFNRKFHFFLYPTASSSPSDVPDCVKLTLWSSVLLGSDKVVGDYTLVLSDWEPGVWHDEWFSICSPLAEKFLPTRIGRSMAKEGLVPKFPIILIPGLASSSLMVEEGNPDWIGEWVWLSLAKIGSQKFRGLFSSSTSSRPDSDGSDEGAADMQFRNEWVRHVCLQPDGCSDPPGIRVRPVPGKDGCAYLSPGTLTNNLSYVMGPLIENLHEFGYTDSDLIAVPYDWRLPPHMLEARDKYFSNLRDTIERTYERCQSPVVVVAHSMGNRVFQYFLHMIVDSEGEQGKLWIDKHVHSYVSVGAPFLGAPKIVRSLATGERMGMEALLRAEEGVAFIRSLGSTGMIMPMNTSRYFDQPQDLVYLRTEEDEGHLPLSINQTLSIFGASAQIENLDAYYQRNQIWQCIPEAPPVKRLFAIYGVNLDTEMLYFYQRNKKGELVFDKQALSSTSEMLQKGPYAFKEGIAYETKETRQSVLRNATGLHGHRSGDGTVPYASLSYCTEWRDKLDLRVEELEGVEHREILNNRLFFRLLIEHVSESLELRKRREQSTVILARIDDDVSQVDEEAGHKG